MSTLSRIRQYGEVFTPPHIVREMLSDVAEIVRRPDSVIFEPACGTGNILVEILLQRLAQLMHPTPQQVLATVATLYGMDILADNVEICRHRLRDRIYAYCQSVGISSLAMMPEIGQILTRNIVTGDSLALQIHCMPFVRWTIDATGIHAAGAVDHIDLIITNPPYHREYRQHIGPNDRSASAFYPAFVRHAISLHPACILMLIPARWFTDGYGTLGFRRMMLADRRICKLVVYPLSKEIFSERNFAGGICWFVWDAQYHGLCDVTTVERGNISSCMRDLDELPVFIYDNERAMIVRKVLAAHVEGEMLHSRHRPFGIRTYVRPAGTGEILLYASGGIVGRHPLSAVTRNHDLIPLWKVVAGRTGACYRGYPRRGTIRVRILPPSMVCTETYTLIGCYQELWQARRMAQYLNTRFAQFLVSQRTCTHHRAPSAYEFVPRLDTSVEWTDEMLYDRYGLTASERQLINDSVIVLPVIEVGADEISQADASSCTTAG